MVHFEKGCGAFEIAVTALAALGLDFAKLLQGLLELAGEALAVEANGGESGYGLAGVGAGGRGEQASFEERDAIEAPSGVGEFLD